ncbi:MAG: hypothetical protein IT340_15270, partial [Chloroflexi bacterium]|nr:hypothetical protein [Chloroflexota bacterium]
MPFLATRVARRQMLVAPAALMLTACRGGGADAAKPTPLPRGDGLVGRYYASRDWSGPVVVQRVDPVVEFDWSGNHPVPSQVFSVRWEGFLYIPPREGGPYTLSLRSDDASWLYLDGQLLVDNGGIHTAVLRSGLADLESGAHQLRIDYAELEPRLSLISFQWRKPNGER